MTEQIRWGILSTARIGQTAVIPAIHKSNNGRVAAVASRSLERAREFAEKTSIPTAYGSYEALIADPNIDAIYIPVPNSEHAEWSIKCAEAGKPTLCEKPLARSAPEGQQMVDAFAERGVLFAEAFMYRFHPQNQRARQMIRDGEIGDVQLISASFSYNLRDEANIRLSAPLAGGALMDVGCYCINVMRFITGEEPDRAQAVAEFGPTSQVDERIAGILGFPSGVVGHFDAGMRVQRLHTYEVRGSAGRLQLEQSFVARGATVIRHWRGDAYNEITLPDADQYQIMVEDFADALINSRPPAFPPEDAVANMAVIDRLFASLGRH